MSLEKDKRIAAHIAALVRASDAPMSATITTAAGTTAASATPTTKTAATQEARSIAARIGRIALAGSTALSVTLDLTGLGSSFAFAGTQGGAPVAPTIPAAPGVSFTPASPAPGDAVSVALFSAGATGYTFTMPGVTVSGSGASRSFTAPAAGAYSWSATASNAAGTSAAATGSLTVAAAGPLPTVLTRVDFSRSGIIFDSGAAFGLNAATITRSGTADPGEVIQVQIESDTGTVISAWADGPTADGSGNWTSISFVARASAQRVIKWRLKRNPAVVVSSLPFYSGHVVDIWGQSELHRSVLGAFPSPSLTEPAISDPLALLVSYSDAQSTSYGSALTQKYVDGTDDNLTKKLGNLANMLAAERPGERFHFVFHTLSGTGARDALDDTGAQASRDWSDEVLIRDFALGTTDGVYPGLAIQSWYNADAAALGNNFGEFWARAVSQRYPSGTLITAGASTGSSSVFSHFFAEWYDYARTKFAMAGPHRFETTAFDTPVAVCRYTLNELMADSRLSTRAVRVLEPLSYQNDPTDTIHPGVNDPDGMPRFMTLIGYGILQGLGISPRATPVLDQWSYNAGTSTLTVGSSAGAVTTTRRAQGGTLPAGRPQVDQVFKNFTLVPPADISFSGGNILIANVVQGDVVVFGPGGIGTGALGAEDITALTDQTWKDWPIVAGGLAYSGIEGLPVRGRAYSPAGVIPAVIIPARSGNTNLLPAACTNLVTAASNAVDGVYQNPNGVWTLNGAVRSCKGTQVQQIMICRWVGATSARGLNLTMSFKLTSPDAARGNLRIQIRSANGGAASMLAPTVFAAAPGTRMSFPTTAAMPGTSGSVDMYVSLEPDFIGTVEISELELFRT